MESMNTPARPDFFEKINNIFNLRLGGDMGGWQIVSLVYVCVY